MSVNLSHIFIKFEIFKGRSGENAASKLSSLYRIIDGKRYKV
jgi:hypothetical protein